MFIFIQETMNAPRIAIPSSQVIFIKQQDNAIYIKVTTGEMETLSDEANGAVVPCTEFFTIKYSDDVAAAREMTDFYKAMVKGNKTYLFTNAPESFEVN